MKKSPYWVYLPVATLLFAAFFWAGKKSRSVLPPARTEIPQAGVKATAAKTPVTVAASTPQPVKMATPTQWQPRAVETLKGGALFSALFDKKVLQNLNPQDLQKISGLFAKPYPRVEKHHRAVMVERLGILKALGQQAPLRRAPSSVMAPELRTFYRQVLENPQENWIVKRQVFRNLKSALTPSEKEAYYRRLDTRVVALSIKSEAEIVEEVLREKR
ncbi:hypothetical protein [Bdellovibrio bacteriovorus]|uniref:Uncharacterized protein n=1 Tax=Bdellovibrio bacteriovorus str. Tiberius TaxID=1069642 RepID=K7Z976_BDEBC|nr:hypothetical protein [Bdellovibrio bacteriovorus]AFY01069.1 Hypothetical protein Bdt_1371 [Bdellovibrio bacteriovorus str. Tiberius]